MSDLGPRGEKELRTPYLGKPESGLLAKIKGSKPVKRTLIWQLKAANPLSLCAGLYNGLYVFTLNHWS